MAVKTPSYWKEKDYQPMVEVETAYGNKVEIPQSWLDTWKMWEKQKDEVLPHIEQAKAAGWFKKISHKSKYHEAKRVYFEQYQE